jgi:hypothetical protein
MGTLYSIFSFSLVRLIVKTPYRDTDYGGLAQFICMMRDIEVYVVVRVCVAAG